MKNIFKFIKVGNFYIKNNCTNYLISIRDRGGFSNLGLVIDCHINLSHAILKIQLKL